MVLEGRSFSWYLKRIWYLLTYRMWLPIIVTSVLTIIFVGNIIYEVATSEKAQPINELEIEYVTYENATEDISNVVEYEVVDPIGKYEFENVGYINVNTQLNVRQEPSTESEILTTLNWMDKVEYSLVNDDWAIILLGEDSVGYIADKYIQDELETYTKTYQVSGDKSKTYMDYRKITDRTSKQYRLQLRASTNEENGLRMLRNRYMVAIGSYFGCKVGQYIDVVLSDGEILECIVGDAKQDIHTDSNNLHGLNGDTVEFIVNENILKDTTDVKGNISDVSDVFDGKVVEVRVYDHIEK